MRKVIDKVYIISIVIFLLMFFFKDKHNKNYNQDICNAILDEDIYNNGIFINKYIIRFSNS